ncbi:MAG: glutathione S-transferase N-terminal domain-containing protein [Chloroflexota bacterium]
MLELYLWTTPNGRKPLIMLEELGVDYEMKPIRLNGEQKSPAYLKLNPNGRIPTLVDRAGADEEPVVVFESGAILIYLAEKYEQFLPKNEPTRSTTIQWLMFQMGGIGPMFGQYGHFRFRDEEIPYAIERYRAESERLYGVLEIRLGEAEYLGGAYSIADMATYPWVNNPAMLGLELAQFPNVKRWIEAVGNRPAVDKAMGISLT